MTEPMNEERLAELQSTRDKARSWAGLPGEVDDVFTDLADAVDEIDRLRAENERYRKALTAISRRDNGWCSDLAFDALYPEASDD